MSATQKEIDTLPAIHWWDRNFALPKSGYSTPPDSDGPAFYDIKQLKCIATAFAKRIAKRDKCSFNNTETTATKEEVAELLVKSGGFCEKTGIPMNLAMPGSDAVAPVLDVAVDAIDPLKPHAVGNLQIVVLGYHRGKWADRSTDAEMAEFAKAYVEFQDNK